MKMMRWALFFIIVGFASFEVQAAAAIDERFLIEINQKEAVGLDIQAATELALPILWKRIVPTENLEKAYTLPAVTSLVLQFKSVKHGVKLMFNSNQVRSFLAKYRIKMIGVYPSWNLSVFTLGFSDTDENLSHDLLNYAHGMADEFGFRLGPRGKKMQLIFAPAIDVYGQAVLHVDVQGAFSSDLLQQTDILAQGYDSYQLQDFLNQVLKDVRDAYSLGTLIFNESSSEILLTIASNDALATQVMMEQALTRHPGVVSVQPALLQKVRRQYRIELRDGDESWIVSWFAGYGLTAVKQPEGSAVNWLVE